MEWQNFQESFRDRGVDESCHGRPFASALAADNPWWQGLCAGSEQAYLAEAELRLINGSQRLANVTRVPLADLEDQQIGSMLVFEDVTE